MEVHTNVLKNRNRKFLYLHLVAVAAELVGNIFRCLPLLWRGGSSNPQGL